MAGAATRKLKVEGLPSDVTKSRLITFFRNEQSQGGGPVEDVIILDDNKSKAIIIFKEPEAVQMIIGRRDTVSISNTTVKVRPYYEKAVNDCEPAQADLTKKMMLPAMEKQKPQFKKALHQTTESVAIHNRTTDLDSSNNKEAGSVEDNYEKEEIMTKKALNTEEETKATEKEEEEITDEVNDSDNNNKTSTDDAIRSDNETVAVTDVCHKNADETNHDDLITSSVNEAVAQRDNCLLADADKTNHDDLIRSSVNETVAVIDECHEETEAFCDGKNPKNVLDDEITGDHLKTYLNAVQLLGDLTDLENLAENLADLITEKTGMKVKDITQQDNLGSCIVWLDSKDSELDIVPTEWEKINLGNRTFITGPVLKTNSILVSGLTEAVTLAELKTYLESDKVSGGGKVKYLEAISDDQQVIVYYEEKVDINEVVKQDDKINGVSIYLSKYFPCLSEAHISPEEPSKLSNISSEEPSKLSNISSEEPSKLSNIDSGVGKKVLVYLKEISMEESQLNLFLNSQCLCQIRNHNKDISVTFDFKRFQIIVKGDDRIDIFDVIDILENCKQDTACLNLFPVKLSEKADVEKKLTSIFKNYFFQTNGTDSKLFYFKSDLGNLQVKLIHFPSEKQELMLKYFMQKYTEFQNSLKSYQKIHLIPENCLILDKENEVELSKNFKEKVIDKIGVKEVSLCFFGIQEFFQHGKGKQMIKEIEDEFRCTIKADLRAGYLCKTSQSKWDFGNITINLIEDEINKQTVTDVVVNSVSTSLDLTNGRLTAVILKEAGDQIQTELKIRYDKGINPGEFAVSTAGKMKCKHIFHACLTNYKRHHIKQMKNLIGKMLEEADKRKAKSISLPALGTGNLNYPPELSCEVILETIAEYANQKPYSHLDHVNIVVYPMDQNVSQAFKTVFFASNDGSGDGLRDNCGDIDDVYLYGNLCLKIKQGDITKEKTDVIINSIKESMDLSKSGHVCRALHKNCGQELQDECFTQKDEMAKNGVVVTSAPKLPCKNIIFLSQDKFGDCWDKGILKVLMEAEKIGATSLALPALGAACATDLMSIKKWIFQAVECFSKSGQQKLTELILVIFDPGILPVFLDQLHKTVFSIKNKMLSKIKLFGSISQNVDAKIYSDNEENRNKAAEKLKQKCLSAYRKSQINAKANLHQLDVGELQKIADMGLQQNIKVTFDIEQNAINFEGFNAEVVYQLHVCMLQAIMSLISPSADWQFKKGRHWHSFIPLLSKEIEKEYNNSVSCYVWEKGNGKQCKIDFASMKMFTSSKRSPFKSSKDVQRIQKETAKGVLLPTNWDPMLESEYVKVVEIQKGSPEYIEVENHFILTPAPFAIKKIERIQNKSLYQQYSVKKKEMDQCNPPGHQNERKLFHGTGPLSIKPINENGFNRSFCGLNGTAYGNGVYFAVTSEYSSNYSKPDDQGNRYMYRARVLTGEFIATSSGTKYLPNKPGSVRPYDSGGDLNKGIYVIFHDSQVYPEYLITF